MADESTLSEQILSNRWIYTGYSVFCIYLIVIDGLIFFRFKLDDGRSITIGEYFQKEKRYALRFPNLPCIHVGNPQKDICLPPEVRINLAY